MKTTYYTLTTWDDGAMAAGFDRAAGGECQQATVCQPEKRTRPVGGDNVIDLNAWRCANPELCWKETVDEPYWGDGEPEEPKEPELVLPAPRGRRDHRRAMCAAELAATLAVAAAALALMLRVLMF